MNSPDNTPDRAVTHVLKTWPEPFQAVWDGRKTAEFRRNDRGFREGDYVELLEYDPKSKYFSGRKIMARITHVVGGPSPFGIPDGFAMLSFALVHEWSQIADVISSIDNPTEDKPRPDPQWGPDPGIQKNTGGRIDNPTRRAWGPDVD